MKCKGACTRLAALAAFLGLLAMSLLAGSGQPDEVGSWSVQDKLDSLLAKAVEVADGLPDPIARSHSLLDAAKAFATLGDRDQAFQLLQMAFQAAKQIPKGWDDGYSPRFETLDKVGNEMFELGYTESAIQAFAEASKSDTVDDFRAHSQALQRVSSLLAQKGNLDEALEIANRIEDWRQHSSAIALVFSSAVAAGQSERALEIARALEETESRSRALSSIAKALANAEQFDLALQVADEIGEELDPRVNYEIWLSRNSALSHIASSLITAGRPDQAVQAASKIDPYEIGSQELFHLSERLSSLGHFQQALQMAQMAAPYARSVAFMTIAQGLIEAGQKDTASQVLERALTAAQAIAHPDPRLGALMGIAGALIDADQKEQALQALEEVLTLAPVAGERQYHPYNLTSAARMLIRLGETEKAKEALNLALKAAEDLEEDGPVFAAQALTSVATAMVEAGYPQEALDALEKVLTLWERITDPNDRQIILSRILGGLQKVAENLPPQKP